MAEGIFRELVLPVGPIVMDAKHTPITANRIPHLDLGPFREHPTRLESQIENEEIKLPARIAKMMNSVLQMERS